MRSNSAAQKTFPTNSNCRSKAITPKTAIPQPPCANGSKVNAKNWWTAGRTIPRPELGDGAPSEELDERQKKVAALVAQLTADIPFNPAERSDEQSARWMLAQLLDWHRRENKASWWEGYRLADLDDEDLMDERAGLAGLRFVKRISTERGIPVDRYAFEKQETEVRAGKDVHIRKPKIWRGRSNRHSRQNNRHQKNKEDRGSSSARAVRLGPADERG